MRGLILGGLGLALGFLVAQARAEEVQWRPAGTSAAPPRVLAQPSAFPTQPRNGSHPHTPVGLLRPQALTTQPAGPSECEIMPVVFTPSGSEAPRIIRAKNGEDGLKPTPIGPSLEGPPAPPGEGSNPLMPMPRPMPSDQRPVPYLTMPQGDAIPVPPPGPPPVTGGMAYHGGALPIPAPVDGCGAGCGAVVEPDWSCCADGGCLNGCCGYDGMCRFPRIYGSVEYLAWWMQGPSIPPLVTTNTLSQNATNQLLGAVGRQGFNPGALGQPGTQVLFGGEREDSPLFHGGRFTIGFGGCDHPIAIETTFLFLGERSIDFQASSTGNPSLYRPFFNVANNQTRGPATEVVAERINTVLPGNVLLQSALDGTITVEHVSRLWGAEVNGRRGVVCDCEWKLDLLAGFRFLELNEHLTIREDLIQQAPLFIPDPNNLNNQLGPIGAAGDRFQVTDHFGTRNRFWGGQVGMEVERRFGRLYVSASGKVALGSMHQVVYIDGSTVQTLGGVPSNVPGGLLAQPTNIGRYGQDKFAVVPELGLKVGYQVTDHLSAYAGYTFLYASSVVRPGDQIDTSLNSTQLFGGQLQGQTRPVFVFRDTDFWAQGFNFGLEARW